MSCQYFAKKGPFNYCTAKEGYILFSCNSDDETCVYYRHADPEFTCPFWRKSGYCSAKGGYVSCGASTDYTRCSYYNRAGKDEAEEDDRLREAEKNRREAEEREREHEEEEEREREREEEEDW